MKKYLLYLPLLCLPAMLKAQTDTVSTKISKLPHKHVDALARFPQGDFKSYISNQLQYSRNIETSIIGRIVLLTDIDADGTIKHITILKNLSPLIDKEVVKVINASPKWKPAMLNGQNVSMQMVFDIDIAVKGTKRAIATNNYSTPVIINKPEAKPRPVVKVPVKAPLLVKKAPLVAIKVAPPAPVKKPAPVIAKKTQPPVVKKIVAPPVMAKQLVTKPVVKKPQPPAIAKTVLPVKKTQPPAVVKKPEPPVVKKANVVIAKSKPPVKKATPPAVVKKASPVIAKKVEPLPKKILPPVAKKPAEVIKKELQPANKPLIAKKVKRKLPKDDLFNPQSNGAMFPGGLSAFFKYLGTNIIYPAGSRKANIEGKVNLSFVIEEDGSVSDVEVISSPAEDLSQEATRVLLASPRWRPARQNKRPVAISYQIPINFTLVEKTTNP